MLLKNKGVLCSLYVLCTCGAETVLIRLRQLGRFVPVKDTILTQGISLIREVNSE